MKCAKVLGLNFITSSFVECHLNYSVIYDQIEIGSK